MSQRSAWQNGCSAKSCPSLQAHRGPPRSDVLSVEPAMFSVASARFRVSRKILIDLWCITEAQAQIVFSAFAFTSSKVRVLDTAAMSPNPCQLELERVIFGMHLQVCVSIEVLVDRLIRDRSSVVKVRHSCSTGSTSPADIKDIKRSLSNTIVMVG